MWAARVGGIPLDGGAAQEGILEEGTRSFMVGQELPSGRTGWAQRVWALDLSDTC